MSSVETLGDHNGVEWAAETLHIRYEFRLHAKRISLAQKIKLSKIANIFTAILRLEVTFTNLMRSLLSYSGAFEEDYGVLFVDIRIKDIVEDMTPSNFLTANFRATYTHYIRIGKMIIKYRVVLPLPVKLARDTPAAKTFGIKQLDDQASTFVLKRTYYS